MQEKFHLNELKLEKLHNSVQCGQHAIILLLVAYFVVSYFIY